MGVYDYHAEVRDREIFSDVMDREESRLCGNKIKTYVKVEAVFDPEGKISPVWLEWENGIRYEIDRVTSVQRAASRKAGGCGVRYDCLIRGQRVELFYEGNGRWFVSRKLKAL